jgi:hypothetical protein
MSEGEAGSIRPYLVTGGRTRPKDGDVLPVEALVECLAVSADGAERQAGADADQDAGLDAAPGASLDVESLDVGPESRRIMELTTGVYLSIAEISAHAQLPVGVVRVLVADLVEAGAVRVHGLHTPALSDPADPSAGAAAMSVLEGVLHGISAL